MAKMSVVVRRDDNLVPQSLVITKAGKKLKLKYLYSPKGDVYSFELEGRREILPSFTDIVKIVDAKRLDRIGTIELIDEVTLIELIKSIQTIGNVEHATIDEITTIRDLNFSPKCLISNPSFEQGLTGWDNYQNIAEISDTVNYYGHSCKFPKDAATLGLIWQQLLIPVGVDWLSEFYFYLRGGTGLPTGANVFRVRYYYADGTATSESFQLAALNIFEKKVMLPTAGKYIEAIQFEPLTIIGDLFIDTITTVL